MLTFVMEKDAHDRLPLGTGRKSEAAVTSFSVPLSEVYRQERNSDQWIQASAAVWEWKPNAPVVSVVESNMELDDNPAEAAGTPEDYEAGQTGQTLAMVD
jgi:hypothetical protein